MPGGQEWVGWKKAGIAVLRIFCDNMEQRNEPFLKERRFTGVRDFGRRITINIVRAIDNRDFSLQFQYEDLVDAYSEPIYRFCRSLTYSKEDADDLFQETFLKTFLQFEKISASENPKGFLFSTALFIWKSWKRKYARRQRLAPTGPLDEAVIGGIDVEAHFLVQEESRMVRDLVDGLPDKFKVPTLLYYTVEMSISEIATTLQLPEGTVKSRLFKARKLIEKGLAATQHEKEE